MSGIEPGPALSQALKIIFFREKLAEIQKQNLKNLQTKAVRSLFKK